eukprot:scaffold3003_cov148-Alexandrium_tamarense.AAC.4
MVSKKALKFGAVGLAVVGISLGVGIGLSQKNSANKSLEASNAEAMMSASCGRMLDETGRLLSAPTNNEKRRTLRQDVARKLGKVSEPGYYVSSCHFLFTLMTICNSARITRSIFFLTITCFTLNTHCYPSQNCSKSSSKGSISNLCDGAMANSPKGGKGKSSEGSFNFGSGSKGKSSKGSNVGAGECTCMAPANPGKGNKSSK